jgi:hypothetical protein
VGGTALEAAALAAPEPAPTPSRRWLSTALVAALIAAGASAVGLLVASHGQLSATGYQVEPAAAQDSAAISGTAGLSFGNAPVLVVRRPAQLLLYLEVRNSGPLPVTVDGVQLASPAPAWIRQLGPADGPLALNSDTTTVSLRSAGVPARGLLAVALRVAVGCPPRSLAPAGAATVQLATIVVRYAIGPLHFSREVITRGLVTLDYTSASC